MRISRQELNAAADAGVLSRDAAEALWRFLSERRIESGRPRFRAAHILYYLGGFIAMSALALFIGQAWEAWAGVPMLVLVLSTAVLGIALTRWFLQRQLEIPAGVMITFAVSMTPLAIYSLQHVFGLWSGDFIAADYHRYIDWRWLFMELGTLAVATVALWYYRLPFTVFLVALTLWYLQMDLVPFLFDSWSERWEMRKVVSVVLGLATVGIAFWVDVRTGRRRDFAFWLYLAGVAAFWGGLTAMDSGNEISRLLYALINAVMLALGAALRRRVFAVFGAMGIAIYLGHLAQLFADSLLFPVALVLIGLGVVLAGVYWQKHEQGLSEAARRLLPPPLRLLIEEAQAQG